MLGYTVGSTVKVTREECQWFMSERRRALEDAVERDTGVRPRGVLALSDYRAYLKVHERDQDGSVRGSVLVHRVGSTRRYVRRLRCVIAHQPAELRTVHLRRR